MQISRFALWLTLPLLLALAACGGAPPSGMGIAAPLECAPFARALSGVNLRGDGGDWWHLAAGRYQRGQTPEEGAAIVFTATSRLPRGHVGVVSRVVSRREILVTQANWVHGRVTTDQLVRDESPLSDWTVVRVWWPPTGGMGSTPYPVSGFIYSGYPTHHDRIVQAVPAAIRIASRE